MTCLSKQRISEIWPVVLYAGVKMVGFIMTFIETKIFLKHNVFYPKLRQVWVLYIKLFRITFSRNFVSILHPSRFRVLTTTWFQKSCLFFFSGFKMLNFQMKNGSLWSTVKRQFISQIVLVAVFLGSAIIITILNALLFLLLTPVSIWYCRKLCYYLQFSLIQRKSKEIG